MLSNASGLISPFFDYHVAIVHMGVVVMLGSAFVMRRSLGALPCWMASFFYMIGIEAICFAQGLPRVSGMALMFEVMFLPTMLHLLARFQIIPGLRRGEWSREERHRWVAQRGFAISPKRPHAALAESRIRR